MAPRGPGMSHVLAIVLGMAIGLATPLPSRAAEIDAAPRPVWSWPVNNGPRTVTVDRRGAVVSTNLGDVIAVDRAGRTRWRAVVSTNPEQPALDGDLVVVGGADTLSAFDRSSGAVRWEQPLPSRPWSVAAAGGSAVVGDDTGSLRAFDAATGAARWVAAYAGRVLVTPTVDEGAGVVIAAWMGTRPVVRALDIVSGAVLWEEEVDWFTATPVVYAGRVLIAEGDGHFHALVLALDVRTGVFQWGTQVRASFEAGIVPAVDDRLFVVVDHFGHVTALDPSDGSRLWERDLDQTVLDTRIALTPHRVTLSTATWDVFVLDRANGRVVRRTTGAQLGGFPVDFAPAAFSRKERLVVVIRLGTRERIELWPLT